MNPLWILAVGMAVVVAGVLGLRLHAFLSLIAGAIVVGLLTPRANVYRFGLRSSAAEIQSIRADGNVVLHPGKNLPGIGSTLLALRRGPDGAPRQVATLQIEGDSKTVATVKWGTVERGDLLVTPANDAAARKAADQCVGERLAEGFGKTAASIGILIALAAVVGQTLLESGAAERVILSLRRTLGDRRTPLAFVLGGFVLCVPCFFETVFYLMIPLGKVMRVRTGRDYTLYLMSIIAGATMAHSLVPPTPGPLFVAGEFHLPLGVMMLGGAVVGVTAAMCGLAYARWANRRWDIPLRESAGLTPEQLIADASRDPATLPPLFVSLVPILLPVALIAAGTMIETRKANGGVIAWPPVLVAGLGFVGDKNVALALAAAAGLLLVAMRRQSPAAKVRESVQHALGSSGAMVLIISAGGAFGALLRQTDVAAVIRDAVPGARLALLPLAFGMTTLLRTAQGSATVAMITVAGILSPLATAGGLGFHPVYLALAIGCGSKPIMWMNDAGFWIISRMSGMTEGETLKTATVQMAIMATAGLGVVVLGAWLLPMR